MAEARGRAWRRTVEYLGLAGPPVERGFTYPERMSATPMCDLCGAIVAHEGQARHREWHRAHGDRV